MKLMLARHGNTFKPDETAVIVGASNDLPLVEKGIEQANTLADALIKSGIKPVAIYCSTLQRTKVYAQIIIDKMKLPLQPIVDSRLNEIDYGDWTGLTNTEICEQYSEEELKNWDEQCIWPQEGNWKSNPLEILQEVVGFIDEMGEKYKPEDVVLAVTSNGRLRYFLQLLDGELSKRIEDKTFKVKTGNICEIEVNGTDFKLLFWNEPPSVLEKKVD
jgi:probable phosphoglycerate mutase